LIALVSTRQEIQELKEKTVLAFFDLNHAIESAFFIRKI
jgi:hypothetical protein